MEKAIVKGNIQKSKTELILEVKQQNPTWTNKQLANYFSLNYKSLYYHIHPNGKKSHLKSSKKFKKTNPLGQKIIYFKYRTGSNKKKFLTKDLINKIGKNPRCYLSGRKIDIYKPMSYALDHIIPNSKGGNDSLENCNIACKEANYAKCDMSFKEFIKLCKDVLTHNGYRVIKK